MPNFDNNHSFLKQIKREDLKDKISPTFPWVYFSMEICLPDLSYSGGLGVLAADTLLQATFANLPFWGVTLAYTNAASQKIDQSFYPYEEAVSLPYPEEREFDPITEVEIKANGVSIPIKAYQKRSHRVKVFALYEPGLKELYHGDRNSEHRLYQQVVLGFGGHQLFKKLDISPAVYHLNESATVFAALAEFDSLVSEGFDLNQAIAFVRRKTLLTNHTLRPAAIASYTQDQFERYVIPNLKSKEVKQWFLEFFAKTNRLRLFDLSASLAGKLNGVSIIHANRSCGTFGEDFAAISNGIFLERWVHPELLEIYRAFNIFDQFDLPAPDYEEKINKLDPQALADIKSHMRAQLRAYLKTRINQYGQPVNIPETSKLACWARRFAEYKRPGMIFQKADLLAQILKDKNIHLILAGKAHPKDFKMKLEIQNILTLIANHEILRERVSFVQDYDVDFAKYLVAGTDIWINNPVVGEEACGTSWMKALANLGIVVSTPDGCVADVKPSAYLKIIGKTGEEELDSLYENLQKATDIVNSDDYKWAEFIKNQLIAYLPTISGGRMLRDYLNFMLSEF